MSAKPSLALQRLSHVELEQISGWGQLATQEQQMVREETKQLYGDAHQAGESRLSMGKRLAKIRDVLKPKRMWEHYIRKLKISRATVNRLIDDYNTTRTILPAPIMQVAMLRGGQRLNHAMIKASPPPKTSNLTDINSWLDKVEKQTRAKRLKAAENDPETLKKIIINTARLNYDKLPPDKRLRNNWLRSISAMVLSLGEIDGEVTLKPIDIPDGYFVPVGRPPLKKEAQRAAE